MFKRTVLSLTLQYSALLLIVFALFGVSVYTYTKHSFDRDNSSQFDSDNPAGQRSTVLDVTDKDVADLRTALILVYGSLVIIIPMLSYGLARRALRPLAESYLVQQQFVDNASHELRTPLSVIQGELELAINRPRPKREYERAIRIGLQEVDGLSRLVQSLLLLARSDQERLRSQFTAIAVQPLVKQVVKNTHETYPHGAPHITSNVPASLYINGSADLIESALANVVDNAMKYTPASGSVQINAQQTERGIVVRVRDTGYGIERANLERAFDRFWRAETARSVKGHGLGLSLTRQIMEIHRGAVSIHSIPDEGSTVELFFPRVMH